MENRKNDLRDNVLRCNQVNIVHVAYILQLDIPLAKLFRRQILAISLMCYVVILTKHTSKIAAGEEDRTGSYISVSV